MAMAVSISLCDFSIAMIVRVFSDFGEYGILDDFVTGESDRLPKMPAESEGYFLFGDFWNPGRGVGGSP